jgi:large subunit ribosomal protein L17
MVTSLLEHERIQTTDAKAKELRRVADRMITLGKRGTLHARRRALRTIRSREVTAKVFDALAERYRDRPGGYTRVLKLGRRAGDAAPLSIIELVGAQAPAEKPGGRAPRKPAKPRAEAAAPAQGRAAAAKAKPAKPAARPAAARKRSVKPEADAKAKVRKASPRKKGSTKSSD